MEAIAILFVFFLGSCIGSFLNVVVYRIPANISIVWPPSRCPICLHKLGITENVPIFGWLWLKGRCRNCRSRISPRYPLVEAVTGCIFLIVYLEFGLSLTTLGYWGFLSWLVALAIIDLDTMTLPNPLTQSGLCVGLIYQVCLGWQLSEMPGAASALMTGIGSSVLALWLFDFVIIIGRLITGIQVMGNGDPKLAAMIGAWLGWEKMLLTAFIACALGAFAGGFAIYIGLISRRQPIPFGPFLATAAGLTVFFGQSIIEAYLNLFFPLN